MVWVLSKVDFTSSSKLYILSDTLFNHVLICTDHAKRRIGSISDLVCSAFVQKWSVQALSEKHLVLKGTSRVVVWTSGLQISPGRPNRIMVKTVPFFSPWTLHCKSCQMLHLECGILGSYSSNRHLTSHAKLIFTKILLSCGLAALFFQGSARGGTLPVWLWDFVGTFKVLLWYRYATLSSTLCREFAHSSCP